MNGYLMEENIVRKHFLKTYVWMFVGVLITFATALFISNSPNIVIAIYTNTFLYIALIIAQLGVVIALSARVMHLPESVCKILFFAYSLLTGVSFSALFIVYTMSSIAMAFLVSALFFGSLVVIGSTTKMDLSGIGTICFAGLIAMLIYTLIAFIFKLGTGGFMYSLIGLVIFMGITAWDAQKTIQMLSVSAYDEEMASKLSIYSALSLYLDFINIFLYILRFVGNRRD